MSPDWSLLAQLTNKTSDREVEIWSYISCVSKGCYVAVRTSERQNHLSQKQGEISAQENVLSVALASSIPMSGIHSLIGTVYFSMYQLE